MTTDLRSWSFGDSSANTPSISVEGFDDLETTAEEVQRPHPHAGQFAPPDAGVGEHGDRERVVAGSVEQVDGR